MTQRLLDAARLIALAVPTIAIAGENVPIKDPIPNPIQPSDITIRLRPVAEGLVAPNWAAAAPGHPAYLYVSDQPGFLYAVNLDTGDRTTILDLIGTIVPMGAFGPGTFDERGLLGFAFHPDYQSNGKLYTYESRPFTGIPADFSTMPVGTNPNHQSCIVEYTAADPSSPTPTIDTATERVLIRIDEPQFNHNAGCVNFGHDGMLYVSIGDGGMADDQGVGHSPGGNAQDTSNILGTIIRIDPLAQDAANGQYGIPLDNPFLETPGFLPEIYAYGLRNPFRFSFDAEPILGDLICADVGQGALEEINLIGPGGNYGWPVKEGTFLFDQNGNAGGFVYENSIGEPPELADPFTQYDHDEGISVIGGFVYRGALVADQLGSLYVCGDYSQSFFGNNGRLFVVQGPIAPEELNIEGQDSFAMSLLGFGQDAANELYVLANSTGIPDGDTGVVLRISPPCPVDLDFSFTVDSPDLNIILASFGCTGPDCEGDLDDDEDTDSADLNILLAAFGSDCD